MPTILIDTNILVALAAIAFSGISCQKWNRICSCNSNAFVFFATLFVYFALKSNPKSIEKKNLLGIALLFLPTLFFFLKLALMSQFVAGVAALFVLFYAIPLHKNRLNGRQLQGFKIVIVALTWTLATYFLPLVELKNRVTFLDFIFGFQRLILIYGIMCIFEIVDLQFDNPNLKTLPQRIGIRYTKWRSFVCFLLYLVLEALFSQGKTTYITLFFIGIYLVFLWKASPKKSRLFADFWLESVAVFWWLFLLFFSFLGTS